MNGGEGYITTEISQRRKRKKGKTERKKEGGTEAPRRRDKLGTHILGREVLSPWDVRPFDPMFLASIGSSR